LVFIASSLAFLMRLPGQVVCERWRGANTYREDQSGKSDSSERQFERPNPFSANVLMLCKRIFAARERLQARLIPQRALKCCEELLQASWRHTVLWSCGPVDMLLYFVERLLK
jgi:hypothetical protein